MSRQPRHEGRCAALQLLYQLDAQGSFDLVDEGMEQLCRHILPDLSQRSRDFAEQLARTVSSRLPEIDALLGKAAKNWRVERMDRVDRNVMRLAVGELLSPEELAPAIIVSQAVELAKEFGSERSGAFVNGVLGQVLLLLGR